MRKIIEKKKKTDIVKNETTDVLPLKIKVARKT